MSQIKPPSEATLKRRAKEKAFDELLVKRFHAAIEEERYSDALQLMEIRDHFEKRSPLSGSYF